jgi:hypothetical protein
MKHEAGMKARAATETSSPAMAATPAMTIKISTEPPFQNLLDTGRRPNPRVARTRSLAEQEPSTLIPRRMQGRIPDNPDSLPFAQTNASTAHHEAWLHEYYRGQIWANRQVFIMRWCQISPSGCPAPATNSSMRPVSERPRRKMTNLLTPAVLEKPLWKQLTFHHFGLILSATFGSIAVAVAFFLILRHATHYLKPYEQKQ